MSYGSHPLNPVFDDVGRQICRWCHSVVAPQKRGGNRKLFCTQRCAQESSRQRKIARGRCLGCPGVARKGMQHCQPCSDRQRVNGRWKTFSTTQADMAAMLDKQGHACPLCDAPISLEAAHIDHDHRCCPGQNSCGHCIRGLLCPKCNQTLGFFEGRARKSGWLDRALRWIE